MKRIKSWFRSLIKIKDVKTAQLMGLVFDHNIYGDGIIHSNYSRSVWKDRYGNTYYCRELFNDLAHHPEEYINRLCNGATLPQVECEAIREYVKQLKSRTRDGSQIL